jgi:hypothetical protein
MSERAELVRYTTDDIDIDPDALELAIHFGGNGDWYVAVVPQGDQPIRGVRITTSGSRVHGLGGAIANAYRAISEAGPDRAVLPRRDGDEGLRGVWMRRFDLNELRKKLAEAEKCERAWSLALQSLTPGGSEYADDPDACVKFVRETREAQHATILKLKKQANKHRVIFEEALEQLKTEPVHLVLFTANIQLRELLAAAEKRAEEAERALRKHLCPSDMADWLACSSEHVDGDGKQRCDVCDDVKPHQHQAESLTRQLADKATECERLAAIVSRTTGGLLDPPRGKDATCKACHCPVSAHVGLGGGCLKDRGGCDNCERLRS